jgi:general stress protein 26
MDDHTASPDDLAKLWTLIKDVRVAMLTSRDGELLRSRPMVASQSSFNGTLWFFTRASSHKVDEVGAGSQVNVSYAEPSKENYVSLSGEATLVRDRALIDQHWSPLLKTWFPNGKDDPEAALLRIDIAQAEYWDAPSSALVHLYGYVKATLTGRSPAPGDNQKLNIA